MLCFSQTAIASCSAKHHVDDAFSSKITLADLGAAISSTSQLFEPGSIRGYWYIALRWALQERAWRYGFCCRSIFVSKKTDRPGLDLLSTDGNNTLSINPDSRLAVQVLVRNSPVVAPHWFLVITVLRGRNSFQRVHREWLTCDPQAGDNVHMGEKGVHGKASKRDLHVSDHMMKDMCLAFSRNYIS